MSGRRINVLPAVPPHRIALVEVSADMKVECYAGYRGEETPRRFYLGSRGIEVVEVLDRWLGPEHRYFKLRGDDDGIYILCHSAVEDSWEMTLFDRSRGHASRLSST